MSVSHLFQSAVLAGVLILIASAPAQSSVPTTYDVSTVRPSAPGNQGMSINFGSAGLKADNVTLEWIMTSAFHARVDQISGAPAWAKDKHFDIAAKLTDTDEATLKKMDAEQHRALLLALLVERFGLKYHVDTREMPTYDLVPAKGGLKLTPAVDSGVKDKEVNGVCAGCTYWGDNEMKAHDIEVSGFAEMLAGQLGRSVHDGTGYSGKIDVKLKWARDLDAKPASDEDATLLPLPQTMEREMGLHLAPTRGPVKVFVIDRLDEPSAN